MAQTYQLVSEVKENDSRACEEHFNISYGQISEILDFWTNFLNLFRNRRNIKIDKMTEKHLFVEELMK